MNDYSSMFSQDVRCMKYSAIRRMARYALRSDIISLAAGAPNADTFPVEEIKAITASILEKDSKGALQYGLTLGYRGLIEAVMDLCRSRKSIEATMDQIAITSGSQQALDLIGRLFLDPGDVVFVELPSYVGGISAFRNLQAELVGVRQAGDGIEIEDLIAKVEACLRLGKRTKLIYVIPNFQNPSGVTISMEKRKGLIEVASRFDLLIVEDDPYGEVCFDASMAAQLRSIKSLDGADRVIYVSSFSKILSAGLRVAWMVASAPIIEKLDLAKQATDLCGSMLDQRIVAECWRRGVVRGHLPRIREFYRTRCRVMLKALQASMPPQVRWTEPAGGLFLWITLPEHLDSEVLLEEAIERAKVTYVFGHPFFVNGQGRQTLRLAFSRETEDNIRAGVHQLAQVFKSHLE
jgi:2-aminoadipate transaminase